MKRAALALALCALFLSLAGGPMYGADCQNGDGQFNFVVLGPEDPSNLWQFGFVRGWQAASSATSYPGGHNHARLVYSAGSYAVEDSPCQYGLSSPNGSTLVVVVEYVEDANTVSQRAYVAARAFAATNPAPTIAPTTMAEVPPASASQATGVVTISWPGWAAQSEVIGYQVVRSSDGIAGWTNVGGVTTQTSITDLPGPGTWYYAVTLAYQGTPTQQVSPHGLAAQVVVP